MDTRYSPIRRSSAQKASFLPVTPRLACVKPVASVHPEPGSNSSSYFLYLGTCRPIAGPVRPSCLILSDCPGRSAFYRIHSVFFLVSPFMLATPLQPLRFRLGCRIDVYCLPVLSFWVKDRCLVACLPVCQRTILLCSRRSSVTFISESECKVTAFSGTGKTFTSFFSSGTHFFLERRRTPYLYYARARKKRGFSTWTARKTGRRTGGGKQGKFTKGTEDFFPHTEDFSLKH